MADNGNNAPGGIDDTVVQQVGAALGQITQIKGAYAERFASAASDEEREAVEAEAQSVMVEAVNGQGLSVEQFNRVVSAAKDDPELGRRVLAVAAAA